MRVRPKGKAGKADVLAAIRRMALLQIDTISVVARSPYFVLWSRLGNYEPAWLDQLLVDRQVFEYWAHEACFIPIEDFNLLRHRMLDPQSMGWKFSVRWMQEHAAEIARITGHIRDNGPVRSADFVRQGERKGTGWWDWKPEKRHLEVLFTAGELMVAQRRNFARVYDLRERVLPEWDDAKYLPPADVAQAEMVRRTCRALGIVRVQWVRDYYRLGRGRLDPIVHAMADAGELVPVEVEGWPDTAFVHHELAPSLALASAGGQRSAVTTLLSPFDPVVWDRKRALQLWDFDYRIECYTPAHKRLHGYFVLPILSRGRLVGRLDAKAHRKAGVFEVKALYLEPGVRDTALLRQDVCGAIRRCATWHGTPAIVVKTSALPLDFS